ncbi:MAG: hypothetical protein Q8R37_01560 [Nanoarchaeota archaeon]|nr:hypothetical protein [Nanoarchaeota archaeon]
MNSRGATTMVQMLKKMTIITVLVLFVLSILPGVTASLDADVEVNADIEVSADEESHQSIKARQKLGLRLEEREDSDNDTENETEETDQRNEPVRKAIKAIERIGERLEEKINQTTDEDREDKLERRKERLEEVKDRLETIREKVADNRVKYLAAKNRYHEAQKDYREKKSELAQLRKEAKTCDDDTDDCEQRKKGLRKGTQQHLLKTIAVMERSLERLLDRVEHSNVLNEEEKETAFTAILELEVELDAQKAALESSAAEMSAEELRSAIQDLKDTWQKVRTTQRRIVAMLTNSKQENLIAKHKEYINGMELRIDDLAAQGVDVSELEDLLREFKEIVARLEEHYAQSQTVFDDLQSGRDLLEQWRKAQKKVREDLLDSKAVLRKFLAEYRELRKEGHPDGNETDDNDGQSAEETKVEVDGNVELSAEANAVLDNLLATFSSVEGEVKLKLVVEKENNETVVEEKIDGTLTTEQHDFWADLKALSIALVEASDLDHPELEIELEHKVAAEDEEDSDESDHAEDETSEDTETNESDEEESETNSTQEE